jgi:hypothetical protein
MVPTIIIIGVIYYILPVICMVVKVDPLIYREIHSWWCFRYADQKFYPMRIFGCMLEERQENGENHIMRLFMCNWYISANILRAKDAT